MSTIKVDTIATRSGSGNITVSNNIAGGGTISGTNITASGTLGVTGLITASAGVAVGGTGAANTLDDYEEGTFTPTLGATSSDPTVSSYVYNVGKYRKVGQMVVAATYVRINGGDASGGSGDAMIKGLPFALGSTGNVSYAHGGFGSSWLYYGGSFSSGRNQMKLQFQPGEAAARIWQYGGTDATNMTGLGINQVIAGQLIISGVITYLTDS